MRTLTYSAQLVFDTINNSISPISAKEVSVIVNISVYTVRSYIRTMVKLKEIYISEWRRECNHITPLYSVGNKESVKKPKPYSRIEIIKRYRKNNPDKVNLTQRKRYAKLTQCKMFEGEDNIVYDLTFLGCSKVNQLIPSYSDTYYFGYGTEQTYQLPFSKKYYPEIGMSNLVKIISTLHGRFNYNKLNIPNWNSVEELKNEAWWSNDGLVPEISQYYPFVNTKFTHAISHDSIINQDSFEPGIWYYQNVREMTGMSFDHFDIVCGSLLNNRQKIVQENFFNELFQRLQRL